MFENIVRQQGWKEYRNKQINQAVFQGLIPDWDEATSLPANVRKYLSKNVALSSLEVVDEKISAKKDTIKTLFRLHDGHQIESVLMMHEDRNTVCVSSQSGCPVGCTFCATGQMGLKRNLTAKEIVDQVLYFARKLNDPVGVDPRVDPSVSRDPRVDPSVSRDPRVDPSASRDPRVDPSASRDPRVDPKDKQKGGHIGPPIQNIVFMGMGEPMLNIENVSKSVEWLTNDTKFGLGKRRITVSSSGYIKQLREFLDKFAHIGLAISLHAPNQELREKLMPTVAKINQLKDLLELCREYSQKTKRRVSYEYILIEGVNDELEHAHELGRILKDHQYFVNLIPYNEPPPRDRSASCSSSERRRVEIDAVTNNHSNSNIKGRGYKKPNSMRVNRFKEELKLQKVPVSVRVSMGADIAGACGQLAGGSQRSR